MRAGGGVRVPAPFALGGHQARWQFYADTPRPAEVRLRDCWRFRSANATSCLRMPTRANKRRREPGVFGKLTATSTIPNRQGTCPLSTRPFGTIAEGTATGQKVKTPPGGTRPALPKPRARAPVRPPPLLQLVRSRNAHACARGGTVTHDLRRCAVLLVENYSTIPGRLPRGDGRIFPSIICNLWPNHEHSSRPLG